MNGSGEESPKGFRMNNLPPAFGRELDCSMTSDGFNLITFAIFPCEDLFIKSDTVKPGYGDGIRAALEAGGDARLGFLAPGQQIEV